ncbi:M12 family metallo-peptidase [Streptomyces sp. NPDC097619]|uniref:InlB B-repeat-containing protein n=1 Tax=Streptomyces sp. NPDC097619 TaxID=3157228 RepID=UPI00332C4797
MTPSSGLRRTRWVALCASALVSLSVTAAVADPAGPAGAPTLPGAAGPAASARVASPAAGPPGRAAEADGREVLRERIVPLRTEEYRELCTPAPFGAPRRHAFGFFEDVRVTAVEDGSEREGGGVTWSGHVEGAPDHRVGVAMRGVCGAAPGTAPVVEVVAALGERVYHVETLTGRPARVRITEEDPDHRAPHAPDGSVMSADDATAMAHGLRGAEPAAAGDPVVIDVIAGYTDRAVADMGGEQQVVNTIRWAERKMNEALADSGVPASIDVIGTYATGYRGDNTSHVMHGKLADPADRELGARAAQYRENYGVDLITVVNRVDRGQSTGQGSLPVRGRFDAREAFSVVDVRSMTDWYNLGHEIGHNLGLFHDPRTLTEQVGGETWRQLLNAPYGTGYVTPRRDHHTIMAYSSACGGPCTAVNQYSNTLNTVDGQPLGNAAESDNAALARLTTPIVADYRTLRIQRTRHALTLEGATGGSARPAVYGPYAPGTVVAVTARPQAGFRHTGWVYDGTEYALGPQVNVTMDAPHTLRPVFAAL